jgi:hypothetical protein
MNKLNNKAIYLIINVDNTYPLQKTCYLYKQIFN